MIHTVVDSGRLSSQDHSAADNSVAWDWPPGSLGGHDRL